MQWTYWTVETRDGYHVEKVRRRTFGIPMGPKPDGKGFVTVNGISYSVNPRRFRRRMQPRFLGLAKREVLVQFWSEGKPEPWDFLDGNAPTDDRTGEKLALLSKSNKLARIVAPDTNWLAIALVLSIVVNAIAIAVLWSQGQTPPPTTTTVPTGAWIPWP